MRTILHSDLNNFYASVECVYDPSLKLRPMAVCGDPEARHGIVLAKNMLAKQAGIQTGEAVWQARQKCPGLVVIAPNHRRYAHFSRMMRDIYARYTHQIEPFGMDEAWLDVTGHAMSGPEIADELRARARDELGVTLSVGVSFNKVFAKLGSDMKKPDATTVITADNYREKVWPLPAGALLYVGPATRRRLAARNLRTIGDVARCAPAELRAALGKSGDILWCYANGLDRSPVMATDQSAPVKSVGNSTTPPRDICDDREAHAVLLALSESVAGRLRDQRLRGTTVCLWVRDCDLKSFTAQHRLRGGTALASEICRSAMALFQKHYRWGKPVRSLGISVSGLEDVDGDAQLSMFPDAGRERRYELEDTVGEIRRKFGSSAILRASLIGRGEIGICGPLEAGGVPVGLNARA